MYTGLRPIYQDIILLDEERHAKKDPITRLEETRMVSPCGIRGIYSCLCNW